MDRKNQRGGNRSEKQIPPHIMQPLVIGPPEITVSWDGFLIADGDTTPSTTDGTDFGSVVEDAPAVVRVFTVRNEGGSPLTLGDVQRVVQRRVQPGSSVRRTDDASEVGPLFPTETLKPSILLGAQEVVSPIHPASDVLAGYVAQCMHEFDEERIEQSLRLLRSVLFERSAGLPVDKSTA